jgi:tripartite ATP-independent transporter DctM subunit
MIPEMNAKGYDRDFNVALTTASATTGLIIPPSNIMIVYAVVAQNVSIAALFIAGIVPGIVVGMMIMLASGIISFVRGYGAGMQTSLEQITRTGLRALPSLGLVIIILGGILGGVFSATEASAIAVAYALLLAVGCYREVKLSDLPRILLTSGKTTAIVMLLIATSQAMSWFLAFEQIPQSVSEMLLAISQNRVVILLIINCLLLGVGTFMDMTPAVLIFTPIFLPVTADLGMDPIHFGIIMIINLCIGLCTPPVGTCLFLGCSVGHTTVAKITQALFPFYFAMLAALAIIAYVPWVTMALPRAFGYTQ